MFRFAACPAGAFYLHFWAAYCLLGMRCSLYKYPYITGTHGSATNPFVISTTEQWKEFVSYCNSNDTSSTVVILTADLDFSGDSVSPAGNDSHPFAGTIYGQGHKITRAVYTAAPTLIQNFTVVSLFGSLNGAKICDLGVQECTISGSKNGEALIVAAIGGWTVNSTLINVSVENDVSLSAKAPESSYITGIYTGGLLGGVSGNINFYKCKYVGTLNHASSNAYDTQAQGAYMAFGVTTANAYIIDNCYCDAIYNYSSGKAQGGMTGHNFWLISGSYRDIAPTVTVTNTIVKGYVQGNVDTNRGAAFTAIGWIGGGTINLDNVYVVANVPLYENATATITNTTITQSTNSLVEPSTILSGNSSTGFTTATYDTTPGGAG